MQARLDLVALEAGVACFGARAPTHAVALLDVVGAEAALASADDATQEELLAGRAQFLNAQTGPFQVLVQAEPVDLDGHLRRGPARGGGPPRGPPPLAPGYVRFCPPPGRAAARLPRPRYLG